MAQGRGLSPWCFSTLVRQGPSAERPCLVWLFIRVLGIIATSLGPHPAGDAIQQSALREMASTGQHEVATK